MQRTGVAALRAGVRFQAARPVGARQHVAHAHAHERVEHRVARRGIVGANAGVERAADLGDQAVGFGEAALLQIRLDEPLPCHLAPVDRRRPARATPAIPPA